MTTYPPETLSQNEWFNYIYQKRNEMIIVNNVCDVVANKGIRASASFVYNPNGNSFYRYEGREIPEKEFEELYPIELKRINVKGDNVDKRQGFIHNKKSY